MKKHSTILFSTAFPPIVGGQSSFVYSRCLAEPDGIEVITNYCRGWREFDDAQTFPVHRFSYPATGSGGMLKRLQQMATTARILKRKVRSQQLRVLETSTVFPGAIVAQLLFPRRRFLLVSYALGDDILRPFRRSYLAPVFIRMLKRVDMFIAISQYTRTLLLEAGVPPAKISIVQPGADLSRFGQKGDGSRVKPLLPDHDLVLLTVCNLSWKKNVDGIIRLIPSLAQKFPGLIYLVVGKGPYRNRLEVLSERLKVADKVVFMGCIPDGMVADVYAAADVFVMVTREDFATGSVEGFGIAFLEASLQGLPVIGPRVGGSSDAIRDGKTGYLVDPNNPGEIEQKISQLLRDSDLRKSLGVEGRRWASRPPDWSPLLRIRDASTISGE